MIHWSEGEQSYSAKWHSENGISPHKKIQIVDDTLTADIAYRLACAGTAMLYKGDFQNARQLLQALARRVDKPSKKSNRVDRLAKEKTKRPIYLSIYLSMSPHFLPGPAFQKNNKIIITIITEPQANHDVFFISSFPSIKSLPAIV